MDAEVDANHDESPSLRSLLETLPQELYDEIYDLTFTAQPGIRYVSKPPAGASPEGRKLRPLYLGLDSVNLLHVDRQSRAKFARSYYGEGAVFICDHNDEVSMRPASWMPWLQSIDPKHLELLNDVRCVLAPCKVIGQESLRRWELRNSGILRDPVVMGFGQSVIANIKTGEEQTLNSDLVDFQSYSVYGLPKKTVGMYVCGYMCSPPRSSRRRIALQRNFP